MLETSTRDRAHSDRQPGANRLRPDLTPSRLRSAITNGSKQFADVDHRGAWVRRYRDVLWQHEADLGGETNLSEGQRSIIRRATMLELQLEMMESKFADNDGAASAHQLEAYQRASNSLRRLLESLGLNNGRKYAAPRDVTGEVVARIRAGTV